MPHPPAYTLPLASANEALKLASDPLLIISGLGGVIWMNQAAIDSLPEGTIDSGITAFLDTATTTAITKTNHYLTRDVIPTAGRLAGVHQTAVVLEITPSGLDEERFLLALTSTKAEGSSLQEKQAWLTSAAHDLKNPLSAIFGYADTLLDTPAGATLSMDQRTILARIRGTAARATELVRNYQHLSQIALKGVAHSGMRVDINAAVHDVVNTTWREDPQHPRVVLDLALESLPAQIDRLHLDRILSNLFTNALKFSPPDSTVTLSTGKDEQGYVWYKVHNWGPPIPAAELSSLFTPFSRLSNSKGKPGSGLGLTIVHQIVEGLGGRILVESSEEKGTLFTVRLLG